MVAFRTNSTAIQLRPEYGELYYGVTTNVLAHRGFDLYIKAVEQKGRFAPSPDGHWVYAASAAPANGKEDKSFNLIKNMEAGMKECLLYLPLYSELNACQVCVPEGCVLEPLESPFRHKIVFHGSSFTHGISCTRAGMSYPMQFMRKTGLQVIPLGFSGNCRMQPYFADVLEDIEADAYVFDPFSNPNIPLIRERLLPFIDRLVKAHPGKPIIIQRTIYWEKENFNTAAQAEFGGRRALSDSLMKIACKQYKDVYYLKPDAALHNGESSTADGVHPNDNGYSLWEASIEKPILKILKKYKIKRAW